MLTSNAVATVEKSSPAAIMSEVITKGDLKLLTDDQRTRYYIEVCESVGLNPLTQPFSYLILNGKMVLYANKGCTDQLRGIRGVSITRADRETTSDGLHIVTAFAQDAVGRLDTDMGAVSIKGLSGEALSNAYMKALTKAKRRVTLSICGLGMLDESEVDSIPSARRVRPEELGATVDVREDGAVEIEGLDSEARPASFRSEGWQEVRPGDLADVMAQDARNTANRQQNALQRATAPSSSVMARVHAEANQAGLSHDDLHDLAALAWDVASLKDLDADQLALLGDALAGLTPAAVDTLRRLVNEEPMVVAEALTSHRLGGHAKQLAAAAYKRAEASWPDRRVAWDAFYDDARDHVVFDAASFKKVLKVRLPDDPADARRMVEDWIEEQIAAEAPDDVDPETGEISEQPALIEATATVKPARRIAGMDN
ncbi:hypothetical protein [Iamia sp.]|uniref:hypothetical protein n=1 Tax=Iamia sp. TaxID=2722710 RepID=UPI002B54F9BF|nr:hypothetical protein [Iamia sp.]HXH56583.1 hypothetical protein [Iamia sp.]